MRRLKSANPGTRPSPADSLNSTLPLRSSLFDFETVATDLYSLMQESDLTKKAVLTQKNKEKAAWKSRCQKLRTKHSDLLQRNTALRNQVAVRLHYPQDDPSNEEELQVVTQCVKSKQLGTLKYMNQELQTAVEELKDAVQADAYLYAG